MNTRSVLDTITFILIFAIAVWGDRFGGSGGDNGGRGSHFSGGGFGDRFGEGGGFGGGRFGGFRR